MVSPVRSRQRILSASIVSLIAACAGSASAQQTWDGQASTDWNTDLNWSGDVVPGGVNALIDTKTGNIATISQNFLVTPVDIFVGSATGTDGLLYQTAGTASTGNGNWMFVGVNGGAGVYDLANPAGTGGTLTGMGLGTGSMVVGNNSTGGRLYVGGGNNAGGGIGTVNVNTSGTLTIHNDLAVGSAGGTGVMNVDAGTIITGGWNFIGKNESGTGANGTLRMSGGTLTNTGRTYVGQSGSTGSLELTGSGKYLNVNNESFIIGEGTTSIGKVLVNGAGAELRSEGEMWIGQGAGGNGSVTVSAGTLSVGNWFAVGREGGSGVLTVSGTGLVQKTDTDGSLEITNGGSTTASGTVNLDGGTLRVNDITGSGGAGSTALLYLNGGTLKPTVGNGNFIGGNVVPIIKNGGAIIDTDGSDITISKVLAPDAGSTGGLVKNGNGTLTLSAANTFTGAVSVNGGTLYANPGGAPNNRAFSFASGITVGSGATLRTGTNGLFGSDGTQEKPITVNAGGTLLADAFADVGVGIVTLAGATLANLGPSADLGSWRFDNAGDKLIVTGNSTASALNVKFSNGASIDVAAGKSLNFTGTITDTFSGGTSTLIKSGGSGTLILAGVNAYTGPTTINAGTVILSGTGELNATSGITVDGSDAKFVQTSSTAVTPNITLTRGAVTGSGTVGAVSVAALATNTIGNDIAGSTLTLGSLSFAGAAHISLLLNGTSAGLATTALIASGAAGAITLDAGNSLWNNGTVYSLISYSTLTGTLANFSKGAIVGLGARQSATLGNSGTAITLSIAGDLPVWIGGGNATWTTATQTPKNWKLQTGGTGTDFLTNDVVLFDDTATGSTAVIIGENVSPVATTFNNTAKNYTLTSPGGFGISSGTLTKNGTGTLTLGGTHTYTGATSLNAGTTNLTGTLGNTAVSVASGATLKLQGAGAISQNTVTVNGTFSETVDNGLSGTAALVLNNGATLGFANSHSGGTTLNAGTLNINHAAALGTGTLSILGGTLDNTSGGALSLSGNNPVRLSTDLNFTGTNALNLGAGVMSLGSDATAQTLNINNASVLTGTTLTFGGAVTSGTGGTPGLKTLNFNGGNTALVGNLTAGTATGMVVNDNLAGTLTLSGTASAITTLNISGGASSIVELGAGNLSVANGGGSILQSITGGTINGTGGGSIVLGSDRGDFGTAGGTTLTVNARITGSNGVDFYNANGGVGLGTIMLTAANTNSGVVNVENTHVILPATGSITTAGQVTVGTVTGSPAVLDINGATLNANRSAAPGLFVGSASGADASLNFNGGAINVASELWVGNSPGAIGTLTQSAGTINVGSWLAIGRDRASGTLNLSGGSITKGGGAGSFIIIGSLGGTGVVNQSGGTFDATAGGIRIGENTGDTPSLNTVWTMTGGSSTVAGEINVAWRSSQATWNVSGTSAVNVAGRLIVGAETWTATANGGAVAGGNPVGTVNISGGSVTINGGDSRIGGDAAITNNNPAAGAQGFVNVSGGSLTFNGNVQIGAYGQGTMTISDTGVVNATGGFPVVGRFAGSNGILNVNGGTFNHTAATSFIVGEDGVGTLNVNGGLVDLNDMRMGHTATGNGTVNLNGGTLAFNFLQKTDPTGTANFHFNGGTLRTKVFGFDLFTGFAPSSVTIESGGAKIDTNGFATVINQGLIPGLTSGGGLNKLGAGVLTLAGANTYTGPTVVEAGVLTVSGSISNSSSITARTGATFDVSSVIGFTVASAQTLNGSGIVLGNLALGAGSKLAPGEGAGTLNIDGNLDLTFAVNPAASAALQFELGAVASSDNVAFLSGALTIGTGVLGFDDFSFSTLAGLASGTYTLFDGLNAINGTLDSAHLSGLLNGGRLGTLALGDNGNDLLLIVVPEPGSAVMLLAGLTPLLGLRRFRKRL